MNDIFRKYLHNPAHLYLPNASYMITGAILYKEPIIKPARYKEFLIENILFYGEKFGWEVQAYVVMDNHYHFLSRAPDDASSLSTFMMSIHRFTAKEWNKAENRTGRTVWYNYWDTCITSEKSYFARFNYIHFNPIKHIVVERPQDYAWSSYNTWLEKEGVSVRKIQENYPFDRVRVVDDF